MRESSIAAAGRAFSTSTYPSRKRWREALAVAGLLIGAGLAAGLAGCAHRSAAPPAIPHEQPAASSPALALLGYARQLAAASPDDREASVRAARRHAHESPGARTYARLAIALGSPHQRLYTPDEAARYARRALQARPSPWDADARQYLADYARLYAQLSATDQPEAGSEQRIADLEQRLSKAQHKLKALSHIEDRLDQVENTP